MHSISSAVPSSFFVSYVGTVPSTTAFTAATMPSHLDAFAFMPSNPEYYHQDTYMANRIEDYQQPYPSSGPWYSDTALMVQSSPEQYSNAPTNPLMQQSSCQSQLTTFPAQPELFLPSQGHIHLSPMSSPQHYSLSTGARHPEEPLPSAAMELRHPSLSPPLSSPGPEHDCTKQAFGILNGLYSFPDLATSDSTPTSITPANESTSNTILSVIEDAVTQTFHLLACPCTGNPHFSTTISFTINKILSLLETVASSHQFSTILLHDPMTSELTSARAAEISSWRHSQHILSQLRKIEMLIDGFQEKYCKTDSNNETCQQEDETGYTNGVYVTLEASLRASVRETFRIVMRYAPAEVTRQVTCQ